MKIETNLRSIGKGISWRFIATLTTIIIVYVFFGRLDLAVVAGLIETIFKIVLFWGHERLWQKIKWGKKKIEPFNIWFTGLPLSGKTTIADLVFKKLKKLDIPLERIDSKDIRDLIPNVGYTREDRNRHMFRVAFLIKTLQKNSISSIASFVSPYEESRKVIKDMTKNTILVYIKTNLETCKQRDYKGVYDKAIRGEIKNFTGISDIFEIPENVDIIIDTEKLTPTEASQKIIKYLKSRFNQLL